MMPCDLVKCVHEHMELDIAGLQHGCCTTRTCGTSPKLLLKLAA